MRPPGLGTGLHPIYDDLATKFKVQAGGVETHSSVLKSKLPSLLNLAPPVWCVGPVCSISVCSQSPGAGVPLDASCVRDCGYQESFQWLYVSIKAPSYLQYGVGVDSYIHFQNRGQEEERYNLLAESVPWIQAAVLLIISKTCLSKRG